MNRILTFLFFAGVALANVRIQGDCMQGGYQVLTNGLPSTARYMKSFVNLTSGVPTSGCTVTVYATGSATKVDLFSDNVATPLANPFTADATGHWYFYTRDGRVDVTLSAAGIASPFTRGDILAWDPLLVIPSVLDFGAKCDGSTDDTTAIQNAINTTATTNGTWLTLPGGSCMFTALTLPDNAHIMGQGAGVSYLKAIAGSSTTNIPLIKNASSTNSNLYLEKFTLSGNSGSQTATDVHGLKIVGVTNFIADQMEFTAIAGYPIFGSSWTHFRLSNSRCSNYGGSVTALSGSATPNVGCIGMDYVHATASSSYIEIGPGNFLDGSATNVGGVKLNGDSTHTFSYVDVHDNQIVVGNADTNSGGATLGVELYSNSGFGFFHFSIRGNVIRGISPSSPLSLSTGDTFGISVCGAGGQFGSVVGNQIRWIGAFSIEVCGSDISVTSNAIDSSANVILNSSIAGQVLSDVVIGDNAMYNPIGLNSVGGLNAAGSPGILVYSQSGGTIKNSNIHHNTIKYVSLTPPVGANQAIHIQCNGGSGTISNIGVSNNSLIGPGTSAIAAISLEQDSTCPVTNTAVIGNTVDSFQYGIQFFGDTNTRLMLNQYTNVSSRYNGTADLSTIQMDPILATNSGTAWPTLAPTTNLVLANVGQYIQNTVSLTNPNIMTWNTTNGSTGAIGGVISTNSRQRTVGDSPSAGWVQTSTSSVTRALYALFGACRFGASFGPATGLGPNPPFDNLEFSAEDTSVTCTATEGTFGGVGIGHTAIISGYRIKNYFIGKTTWNPGAISAGAQAGISIGITGCKAGDMGAAGLSTLTGLQTLILWATPVADGIAIQLYNFGGSPITVGSGTLTYSCVQSI